MGEYKRDRHGTMFTLPHAEKTQLNDFATSRGQTVRQTLIDGLDRLYSARDMPPIHDE